MSRVARANFQVTSVFIIQSLIALTFAGIQEKTEGRLQYALAACAAIKIPAKCLCLRFSNDK